MKTYKIFSIILIVLLMSLNSLACKPMKSTAEQKQLMKLRWRADRNVLFEEDYELIDRYLTEKNLTNKTNLPIHSFAKIIASFPFNDYYLKHFKNWALMIKASNQTQYVKILDDIIWWSEARLMTEKTDLLTLQANSNQTNRVLEVMSLFVEHGMVNELQKWQTEVSLKKSDLIFDLAIRKAKIVNLFNALPADYAIQMKVEFIESLNDVFPVLEKGHKEGHDHLHWLFKKLGQYNDLPEVRQLLITLKEDPLYYHQEQIILALEKLADKDDFTSVEELRSTIIGRISIIPWAMEALKPEDPYSSREYYGCY